MESATDACFCGVSTSGRDPGPRHGRFHVSGAKNHPTASSGADRTPGRAVCDLHRVSHLEKCSDTQVARSLKYRETLERADRRVPKEESSGEESGAPGCGRYGATGIERGPVGRSPLKVYRQWLPCWEGRWDSSPHFETLFIQGID
jgi:hypothetical protein